MVKEITFAFYFQNSSIEVDIYVQNIQLFIVYVDILFVFEEKWSKIYAVVYCWWRNFIVDRLDYMRMCVCSFCKWLSMAIMHNNVYVDSQCTMFAMMVIEQDHISNFHQRSSEAQINCGEIDCDNITNESMHHVPHTHRIHLAMIHLNKVITWTGTNNFHNPTG